MTLSLDDDFLLWMDEAREGTPRSRFIEAMMRGPAKALTDAHVAQREKPPTPKANRSPEPGPESKPPREAKAERLEKARTIVQQPWGGVGGRAPIPKRSK